MTIGAPPDRTAWPLRADLGMVPEPAGVTVIAARRGLAPGPLVLAAATVWVVAVGVTTLDREGQLVSTLASGWAELVAPVVLGVVAVAMVCERRWPAEPQEAVARGHLHDGAYFALHLVAVVPLMTLLGVAFGSLLGRDAGWIEAPWTASWPRWLLVGLTLVLMDGCNWMAHWADHRSRVLWRMHALHHSQEEVSVLTSFRAHPLSHLPGFLLATVPVVALMGDRGIAPVLISLYVCLGSLPHANLRWTLGPVGKVVVSPAYHRLHHAIEGPYDVNLGVVLTVWDVLSGRARFPVAGAPSPATGLADSSVPTEQSVSRWLPLGLMAAQLVEPFFRPTVAGAEGGR